MNNKLILKISAMTTLSLMLVGCSGSGNQPDSSANQTVNSEVAQENEANEPEVTIDQLPYSIEEQAPDSIGEVYGIATFVNNSKYPIKYFELEGTLPTKNEKTYFISSDTVMPGETSSNFESFYETDMSITKIAYTYVKDEDEFMVEYDIKLDTYDTY